MPLGFFPAASLIPPAMLGLFPPLVLLVQPSLICSALVPLLAAAVEYLHQATGGRCLAAHSILEVLFIACRGGTI